ncbi:MAG: dihydrofolate reductase family protein [Candidatus Lokiarchaeota archaeon]|nr:dihydrofolate reductase family protein [Candidatus Lokiarchaeota archaeon]
MNKPFSTLFMLMSVDGKISTGTTDKLDFDTDFPKIKGLKEGLYQYYNLEQETDLYSLNSGRVQVKIGANEPQTNLIKLPVSFLIIDNKPHLNIVGIENFIKKSKKLFIITTNKSHPAFLRKNESNLEIIYYEERIDFYDLFIKLKEEYNIDNLTIQTGGTLNSILLRNNLIDRISIVIAPALIGGKHTSSLLDGISLSDINELKNIKALKLVEIEKLSDSYIHIIYNVINDTVIDYF